MQDLFTNRNDLHDFVRNAFTQPAWTCDIKIAVAFFSDSELVRNLAANGCSVKMIVRLGAGTAPEALAECVDVPGVQIRYFSARTFHPKLYIFGNTCALLGSANLTGSGMTLNTEVAVTLPADDPRFDELDSFFRQMWSQAKVLDSEVAKQYADAVRGYPPVSGVDNAVKRIFGSHGFSNITRANETANVIESYVEDYRKEYQPFRVAFSEVLELYAASGERIIPEDQLPLRIEVDQLFNFIREECAPGESYRYAPLLKGDVRKEKIRNAIEEYRVARPEYLFIVARERYPTINAVLGSKQRIEEATTDVLYGALLIVHAFNERLRWFDGGAPTMKQQFLADNSVERIKHALSYLIHGRGDYVERMADCTHSSDWRLKGFGVNCVKETLGWVNAEDIPICNGRTLKSLRWLGFDLAV